MKDFKKNLLCAAISAATLFSSVSAFASVPSDVVGTGFEEPIQVLAALDIMVGDGNGEFRPKDNLTRAEVTKIAIHAMGLEDAAASTSGQSKFPDVSTEFWANGYINLATSNGIIIGDDEGNFRPLDPITYAEAMTIMVRAIGFEPSALQKGGFPHGYVLVGSENGLNKQVSGTTHEPITRGNMAYLTLNSIKTKMMEQTSFGENPKYEIVDKTLLKDRLGVTEHTGQITAIPTSAIDGTSALVDGQVKIGTEVYDTEYNVTKLLGYNVNYYVRKDRLGHETVILALPIENKNSTLTIGAEQFDKISTKNSNKAISYFKSETSSKTELAELAPDAKLIYNGKYNELTDELITMTDKAGEISLLDTDKDGKYDIVFVSSYYNMVVDTVSSLGKINDKYEAKSITLDDEVTFTITRGLENLKVSDLKEFDVLSVAESKDGELFEIIVSNKTVTGKISSITNDEYTIDGKAYKIAKNYKGELKIGTEATFYLDFEEKIAATDTAFLLSSNYGYMSKAYAVDGDEVVKFRIFTKEGKEEIYEGAEKIKLNGAGAQKAQTVLASLQSEGSVPAQLITFKLNADGKVSEINTAADNSATGEVNKTKFTLNYKLTDAEYNATLKKLGNVKIDKNTMIFDIPSDNSQDFQIADISMFEDEQKYDVFVYDMTEDFTARAIIVTNAHLNTNAESSIAVVKEIAKGQNADEEVTDVLVAYMDGKEVELFAEDETVLVKGEGDALETGDIIQIKQNADKEIVSIRVLFDVDTKNTEATANPAEHLNTVYGKVTKKFTNSINVTVNGGSAVNYELSENVKVYKVDTTVSKNNITVAETSDIQVFDAEENNRVFIKLYKDEVQEIVIIQ